MKGAEDTGLPRIVKRVSRSAAAGPGGTLTNMKNVWGRGLFLVGLAAVSMATVSAIATEAEACGGCFIPPERVQAVTDHRMVLSVGSTETILWDQFRYTGTPSEFAWVLPVTGEARVELASSGFFDALDAATAVTVNAPVCTPSGGLACGASAPMRSVSEMSADAGGVTVLRQETVGPYETVVLRATGADVLTEWLRTNGFSVPGTITPIIEHYTNMRADFVALKLRPGATVQSMQPVRVRMRSSSMVLPLRMVAAGIADKVGITLWVFAPGRWEAANYPNAEVQRSHVAWNYDSRRSDYADLAQQALSTDRRTWLTEMSEPAIDYANFTQPSGSFGAPRVSLAPAEQQAAQADFAIATQGNTRDFWITRMRADLPGTMLDRDLTVRASTLTLLPANFTVVRTRGTPPNGCPTLGTGCAALPVAVAGRALPAVPFALVGIAALARRVSRSRRGRRSSSR
jgi:hypothetical protein